MKDITLQELLEAGCHFGHKSERRHPKAESYIYTEKDGIHIIDLAKTKEGLDKACAYVRDLVAGGSDVLFVGTKRQAKDIVKTEAERVGAAFIVERWIGGFLTNWEGIQKTIKKIISMTEDQQSGGWKKFPKHEQVKMAHHLKRLNMFYGGVVSLKSQPAAIVIVDIKKEGVAFREALRCNVPMIAMVDTNVNPSEVSYPIPANDDAVGSINIVMHALAEAYAEGKAAREKDSEPAVTKETVAKSDDEVAPSKEEAPAKPAAKKRTAKKA